jgi:DNA polymerase-1
MGLAGGQKSKTGAYATGADVLETLSAQGHDLPARVLDWRQLSKLKSTYADALVEQINPETGRLHTSFALAATSTGRLSSNDPNLQNIPVRTEEGRKIRRAFVAERGHKLLSVDYSQIELRLAAHVAEVAALKEAFKIGADIHAMTASQVFGVPEKGMDPMVRRRAKAINFGIIGISPFGLGQQLIRSRRRRPTSLLFRALSGIRDYMERTRSSREHGYVLTVFGRRCHAGHHREEPGAPQLHGAPPSTRCCGHCRRHHQARHDPRPPALAKAKLKARMLLQVHDELLFEVPERSMRRWLAKVMERGATRVRAVCALIAETGVADNWADAH